MAWPGTMRHRAPDPSARKPYRTAVLMARVTSLLVGCRSTPAVSTVLNANRTSLGPNVACRFPRWWPKASEATLSHSGKLGLPARSCHTGW